MCELQKLAAQFYTPYKDKFVDCGRKLLREKDSKMQKRFSNFSFKVT
jgi:hypothetical protein